MAGICDLIRRNEYLLRLCSINESSYEMMKVDSSSHYGKIWKEGEDFGKRGWTIPINTNPKIIHNLLQLNNDKEFDNKVGAYISQDYKDGAYNEILGSLVFPKYLKDKFIQSHKAMELDLLHPAITSLIAVCEGYLSYISNTNTSSWKCLREVCEDALASKTSLIGMYMYSSISGFIEYYFAYNTDFSDETNEINLNRHWIMHGRSKREITIFDYFRVFNFLRLLIYLNEEAENVDLEGEDNNEK